MSKGVLVEPTVLQNQLSHCCIANTVLLQRPLYLWYGDAHIDKNHALEGSNCQNNTCWYVATRCAGCLLSEANLLHRQTQLEADLSLYD